VGQPVVWLAVLAILYCLAIIVASAGVTVAVSMAIGLSTAPLFGAFLAVTGQKVKPEQLEAR
jgi:arginine:agmatine antiporter